MTTTGQQEKRELPAEVHPQAVARANATPLPGPLAVAFTAKQIVVTPEVKVRSVVHRDWARLHEIKSPLIALVEDIRQNPKEWQDKNKMPSVNFSPEDSWMLCWMFTHTIAEYNEAMAPGLEHFRDKAIEDVGEQWTEDAVALVQNIIMFLIGQSWLTALQYAAKVEKESDVSFFRDTGATQRTASDGGSSTSAASA